MIKKIIRYFLLSLIIMMAGLLGFVYLFEDQIIQRFVAEANRYIATPVRVKKISLSAIDQFPRIALTFDQVRMEGATENPVQPLAVADKLFFTFNFWDLLRGDYVVDQVWLQKAQIYLQVSEEGNNYAIFRTPPPEQNLKDQAPIRFKLNNIVLSEVAVTYADSAARQQHQIFTNHADATLQVTGDQYNIWLRGNLLSEGIRVEEETFFKKKSLNVQAVLRYEYDKRHLTIEPSMVYIGPGEFLVQGTVNHAQGNLIDLSVDGKHTDLQTIVSLLPQATIQQLAAYQSEGNVYFKGSIKGKIDAQETPSIQVHFGCQQATFYHPDYQKRLNNVNLTGSFTNGAERNLNTATLTLQNIEATLDGRPVKGNFSIHNFRKYYLTCQAEAELDVNSLLDFYPIPQIRSASGLVKADFSIAGSLQDLQNVQAYRQQRVKSDGDITFHDLDIQFKDMRLPLHAWNGNFMFKNNDLALNNLSGYLGNSHFLLNGLFKNALAYVLTKHQFIRIEADLHSNLIDVDELLSGNLSTPFSPQENINRSAMADWQTTVEKQSYQFGIDPRLLLNFTCDIKKLKFRRFKGKDIRGKLNISQQVAKINNLTVEAAGGRVAASGTVNAQSPRNIIVSSAVNFQELQIDSVFYIFEEFGQDFLTSRHLKGNAFADIQWIMHFNKALHLDYPSLRVDALTTIRSGQLNDFEPMQRLSRFVEEKSLARLRFAEMSNRIQIAQETIFIPRMMVSSNVSDMYVQGTHTFSNHINYHFEVPARSFSIRTAAARERAAQRERSFGEVVEGNAKPMMLFLKATGTVDDYKFTYDMGAANERLKQNLQEEKKELKEIIKNKGQKAKSKVELEDEYFDFDESENPK